METRYKLTWRDIAILLSIALGLPACCYLLITTGLYMLENGTPIIEDFCEVWISDTKGIRIESQGIGTKFPLVFLSTGDSGENWQEFMREESDSGPLIPECEQIQIVSEDMFVVWQDDLAITYDAGKTWQIRESRPHCSVDEVKFHDRKNGIMGLDCSGYIVTAHTTDSGVTWEFE